MTKTRKDGSRGRLRFDYGDPRDPQAAIAWLWKFVDGAKTAGELYGRALVVIAAEQYATPARRARRPADARHPLELAQGPRRQGAAQARRPARPASLTRLEQAVKRAHTAYEKAETAAAAAPRAAPATRDRRAGEAEHAVAATPRGPTHHPMARPGGRAGGRGSARAPGAGHPTARSPRCPVASTVDA